MKKKTAKIKKTSINNERFSIDSDMILFDGQMRKTFIEGILQDIKGYFESKTDGKVAVSYVDFNIKNYEFGFKLFVEKTNQCKKQLWSETASAIVNVINYMFPASNDHSNSNIDVMICTEDNKLEIELVSCW